MTTKFHTIADVKETIKQCDSICLLGVTLTSDMKLHQHGQLVLKTASAGMSVLRKLKQAGFEPNILWRVFNALVFSHLPYCWPGLIEKVI